VISEWLSASEVGERLGITAKAVKQRNQRDPELERLELTKKLPDGQWMFSKELCLRWEDEMAERESADPISTEQWKEALEFSETERRHERDRVHQLELMRLTDENVRLKSRVATLEHQVVVLAQLLSDAATTEPAEDSAI